MSVDHRRTLSLIAYYDDVQRNLKVLNEGCERQFLNFVENVFQWRSQWAAVEAERSSLIVTNRNLEVRLEQAQAQLDRQQARVRCAKQLCHVVKEQSSRNENILELLRECLNNYKDVAESFGNGEKAQFLKKFIQSGRSSSSASHRLSKHSSLGQHKKSRTRPRVSKAAQNNRLNDRSAGSMLDSDDLTSDDSNDEEHELSYLRNGKRWTREKIGLRHMYETDGDVALTTTSGRTDPARTIICTERRLMLSTPPERATASIVAEKSNLANHNVAAINPEVGTTSNDEGGFSPTLVRSSSKRFKQSHRWLSKVVLNLDKCFVCGKRFGFNRASFKCVECRTIVHPNCKDAVSLPCVSLQGGTPSTSTHQVAADSCGGGYLVDYCGTERPYIPALIVHCIAEIERRGLRQPGLYRLSSSEKLVKDLHARFMRARAIPQLTTFQVNILCGCVKLFLSSLREPLITFALWPLFRQAALKPCLHTATTSLRSLPIHNRDTLAFMLLHLQAVANHAAHNEMTLEQLARVFAPILVGNSSLDVQPIEAINESPSQMAILNQLLSFSSDFFTELLSDECNSKTEKCHDSSPLGSAMLGPVHADQLFQPQLTPAWSKQKFFPEPRLG